MQRLTVLVLALLATLAGAGLVAAQEPGPPDLTAYDALNSRVTDLADVTDEQSTALRSSDLSVGDAIQAARAVGAPERAARVFRGKASQYMDSATRDVYLVLVSGGTFPFDGPVGVEPPDRNARVTGYIIDAATGEFLRGFMHE